MTKSKSLLVVLSLGAASLLSACNPMYSVLEDLRPAKDLCTDMGDGDCTVPVPDDLSTP